MPGETLKDGSKIYHMVTWNSHNWEKPKHSSIHKFKKKKKNYGDFSGGPVTNHKCPQLKPEQSNK